MWLGGRDRLGLSATARLVLQYMAFKALDNGGSGVGDERRYRQTRDGRPAQLFTMSREKTLYELGINERSYQRQLAELRKRGLVTIGETAHRGRSQSYRLHVAEMFDTMGGDANM
ncbi:hypothetical protein G1C96_1915 [Bifidobacterium sp. DSM 109958]|uniref:Uncharacterized protein n=2 Tax=Bifidobacterium moraviense TaxID=2675323 RepID=A0A7Y0HYI5_9BIFI|nr:hypothetical protein [Bifidobacterium sp. DSM 109958]